MSLRITLSFFAKVSLALLLFVAFVVGSAAFASSNNKVQCVPQTVVSKTMIIASLATMAAPADHAASTENILETQTIAPRSEWMRVAPLVTKRCCGGYSCDQRIGTCVCKRWC